MFQHQISTLIFLCCMLFAVQPAGAATLTFNGTASEGDAIFSPVGSLYSEAGFTMQTLSGFVYFIDNNFNNDPDLLAFDDDVVEFNSDFTSVRFTANSGFAFSAQSLVVGALNSSAQFILIGNLVGGGTVSQIVPAIQGNMDVIALLGFANLVSLQISAPNDGMFPVFDNLVLTEVPLPGALPLFGGGLGLMSLFGWWRRRTGAAV
jgi:hypothetical protein